jgi:hypothetical protein
MEVKETYHTSDTSISIKGPNDGTIPNRNATNIDKIIANPV